MVLTSYNIKNPLLATCHKCGCEWVTGLEKCECPKCHTHYKREGVGVIMEKEEKKAPKKYRAGNLEVCVWNNQGVKDGNKFEFKTVTMQRNYKDKNDEWQGSNSFNKDDLPKLIVLLQSAYESMIVSQND